MAGDFMVAYVVDGMVSIKDAGQLRLPEHIFGTKIKRYTKGFRLEVPALEGTYEFSYTPEMDVDLFQINVGCSGYSDSDYWQLWVGDETIPTCETIYTKELHEGVSIAAIPVIAGTVIKFEFLNNSCTSKIVYVDLVMRK